MLQTLSPKPRPFEGGFPIEGSGVDIVACRGLGFRVSSLSLRVWSGLLGSHAACNLLGNCSDIQLVFFEDS